jgi:hypothetical protein
VKQLGAAANAELLLLRKRTRGDLLTPEMVLDFASDETTTLHALFEWDDSEAAYLYRLDQAREVIRLCISVIPGTETVVRAFVSLSTDRSAGGGYRSIEAVLSNTERYAVMLQDALAELRLFERKYKHLRELSSLWPIISKIKTPPRKDKPAEGNQPTT